MDTLQSVSAEFTKGLRLRLAPVNEVAAFVMRQCISRTGADIVSVDSVHQLDPVNEPEWFIVEIWLGVVREGDWGTLTHLELDVARQLERIS